MKKLTAVVILMFASVTVAQADPAAELLVLSGYGEFLTAKDGATWNVVLELDSETADWTVIYAFENRQAVDRQFPWDGYEGPLTVTAALSPADSAVLYLDVVSDDGLMDLRIEHPGGREIFDTALLAGGFQLTLARGITWYDYVTWKPENTRQPVDCDNGGPGSESCSVSQGNGMGCSVSCGPGYYSCCNYGGVLTLPKCRCLPNVGAK